MRFFASRYCRADHPNQAVVSPGFSNTPISHGNLSYISANSLVCDRVGEPLSEGFMESPLLSGPVERTLIVKSIPTMLGLVSMAGMSTVDVVVLGQLGTAEQAGATFCGLIIFLAGAISTGLANGCTVLASSAIGGGNGHLVPRYAWSSAILLAVASVLFVPLGLLHAPGILQFMGASASQIQGSTSYLQILVVLIPILAILQVGNGLLRAFGDLRSPGLGLFSVFVVKILTVHSFTFGVGFLGGMGMTGAGISSFLAWSVGAIYILGRLATYRDSLRIDSTTLALRQVINSWGELVRQGAPVALSSSLSTLLAITLTKTVASAGDSAVATVGILSRIEGLVTMLAIALSLVLVPFIGVNAGAGNRNRILRAIRFSRRFCIAWGITAALLVGMLRGPIAASLSHDLVVQKNIAEGLLIIPWGYAGSMIVQTSCSALNAFRKSLWGLFLNGGYMLTAGICITASYARFGFGSYYWAYCGMALLAAVPAVITVGVALSTPGQQKVFR